MWAYDTLVYGHTLVICSVTYARQKVLHYIRRSRLDFTIREATMSGILMAYRQQFTILRSQKVTWATQLLPGTYDILLHALSCERMTSVCRAYHTLAYARGWVYIRVASRIVHFVCVCDLRLRFATCVWFSLVFQGASGLLAPFRWVNILQSTFRMCSSDLQTGPQIAPPAAGHSLVE